MTRVCPLFAMLKSGEVREHDARCLEDKCAWFNRRERYCSINEIADSLSLIPQSNRGGKQWLHE